MDAFGGLFRGPIILISNKTVIIRKPLNPLEKYFPCNHVQIPYKILSYIPKSDPDSCCIEVSNCFWKRPCYSNDCTLFFKVSDLDFDMFSRTNSSPKEWGCDVAHNPQLMCRLLPYHQNHETNPSGLQPQATNGKILEGLSWNGKKGSLGMSLGEEITSLTSPRGVISPGGCIQATLTNMSCPSHLRGGKASLYELCVRQCERGRHVKKSALDAGIKERRRRPGEARAPVMGLSKHRRPSLPVAISSVERGHFPAWATAVSQYHLSARSISGWDKAVSSVRMVFEHSRGRTLSGHLSC